MQLELKKLDYVMVIHQSTTTITFSGQYCGWNVIEQIAYGKNKDHRPGLKQLVPGLSIQRALNRELLVQDTKRRICCKKFQLNQATQWIEFRDVAAYGRG